MVWDHHAAAQGTSASWRIGCSDRLRHASSPLEDDTGATDTRTHPPSGPNATCSQSLREVPAIHRTRGVTHASCPALASECGLSIRGQAFPIQSQTVPVVSRKEFHTCLPTLLGVG